MPKRQKDIGLVDKIFLIAAIKGVALLFKRFIRNLFEAILVELGFRKRGQHIVTVQYPDDILPYPLRYRGR
ncbi:MAG: hypothetical protein N2654_04790, partial [Deltaproteobacteria bacterium]|nr:hypothetical protein [Deltaproteobacteria bacterium]